MAANTLTPNFAVHNVAQAGVGTVDLITFSRPGNALWVYNRGAGDLTIVVGHPGKPVPADPAALQTDALVIPAGGQKSWVFPHAINVVKLVSGSAMLYDVEVI